MSKQNIENIYDLSPMQEGMLFHSLAGAHNDPYCFQHTYGIRGNLNVSAFSRAWQQVVDRHQILRTAFHWDKTDNPLQIVFRRVNLAIEQEDWRGLSPDEGRERLEAYCRSDRERGFDLSKAPLMRLTLIRMTEDTYEFIWTFHHILLDGWSMPILINDVSVFYEAFRQNKELAWPPPRPFSNYIAWLQKQDISKAEQFWRRILKGVKAPAPLALLGGGTTIQWSGHGEEFIQLTKTAVSALRSLARQQQMTANTIVQGAWALLLCYYSKDQDVIFGTVVSGRPPNLEGVETMVGLFINTLPTRVQVTPEAKLIPWLKNLQAQQVEARDYEYSPLVQVKKWADAPRGWPLFESTVNFGNFPISVASDSLKEIQSNLSFFQPRVLEKNTYPLGLNTSLDSETTLTIRYDRGRFDASAIKRALANLRALIESILADPERTLAELLELVRQSDFALKRGLALSTDLPNQLPLTPNGKPDHSAPPAPGADAYVRRGYEAPEGVTETRVAQIWAELLKVERVGRQDHFFDLGGHSLLAVQVRSRLQQSLGVDIPLACLFTCPVLADFARMVEGCAHSELPPITAVDRNNKLELSFAQQWLWFLAQLDKASRVYHIVVGLRLTGDLDRPALRRALDQIVARHEALRTTFSQIDGRPIQVIGSAENGFHLLEHDLRQETDAESELRRLAELEAREPFDLERGPLIRGRLAQMGEDEHRLLVTTHHIVSDGWSMGVLVNELSALYDAYRRGEAAQLPELPIQYADYAAWQRQWLSGEVLERQAEYWKTALAGAPALLEAPADRSRPAVQDYDGKRVRVKLEEGLTCGLKALSRRRGTTLYMTLLAGWAALLGRLSGQEEVVIGTPVANRTRMEIEGLIGFFVNTLALRIDLSGGLTVGELLERVKERALEGQQNQDISFEQVVEIAQTPRSLAYAPIFQVMFAWQNAPEGRLDLPGLAISWMETPQVTTRFDLTLSLQETGQGIFGGLEYATSLYERETVERYLGYWRRLLEGMVEEEQVVDRLELLSETERRQLLEEWNETEADYPKEKCVHELFEEQVERSPEAVALSYEDEQMSYAELNAQANRLAAHLRDLGVGPDGRVAICMVRSVEMVVALLAVLKAGGAYVPLDPSYPPERLGYMLEDSAPAVLLTHDAALAAPVGRSPALLILNLDGDKRQWAGRSERNPDRASIGLDARSLAYILYTSGSTGKPKGVAISHLSIRNHMEWIREQFTISERDCVLQKTPFTFDASGSEFYAPLFSGGRMVIARPEGHRDTAYLISQIQERQVSLLQVVPSLLSALIDEGTLGGCRTLRAVFCAGEALSEQLQRRLREELAARLVNFYGPTEVTIDATYWEAGAGEGRVAIGRPVSNTQAYVLGDEMGVMPVGVQGELYLGGAQLARGYLNQAWMTGERFAPNPFGLEPGGRLYRTGDRVRWRSDGNLEFVGRMDEQVKLRGYRIELGEIEATVMRHPGVARCAVVVREDGLENKRLVAYVAPEADVELEMSELREKLREWLPEHMAPSAIVVLDSLPLHSNGKIDRKALSAFEAVKSTTGTYVAPRNLWEICLAQIWQELLGIERVGVKDNFFQLGGDSLLLVRMAARIQKRINQKLQPQIIIEAGSIERIAQILNEQAGETSKSPLVVMQPNGSRHPFFCVHPGSGRILGFHSLAQYMGEDQPFYGIQDPNTLEYHEQGEFNHAVPVEEMAASYIEAVKTVQPRGPYHLGGWSFGGYVAFEMAQQLVRQGEEVGLLAILDAWKSEDLKRPDDAELLARLCEEWELYISPEELRPLLPPQRTRYIAERLKAANLVPGDVPLNWISFELNIFKSRLRVMEHYVFKTYQGRITLFLADELSSSQLKNIDQYLADPTRGWDRLSTEPVDVQFIPGNHAKICSEPNVKVLAEKLKACLEYDRPHPDHDVCPEFIKATHDQGDDGFTVDQGNPNA
jgi:amino acid adenylation domain-containing protein